MDATAAFRTHARSWLQENFPSTLKGMEWLMDHAQPPSDRADLATWRTRIAARGWGVPTWPTRYGGGGLNPEHATVLREEMHALGAWQPVRGMGVSMFGPTLLEIGNEAQLQRFVPSIADGSVRWCQGFSEPGAGSDLAALATRAEDRGGHFVLNGRKVWTSGAQWADWCFCLVRTRTDRKQGGITFLVFDMRSPGVEVRPIRLISGGSPFCEMTLTDVCVPKDQVVGEIDGGWAVAKRLLEHERQGISGATGGGEGPDAIPVPLLTLVDTHCARQSDGRLTDSDLRARLTKALMRERAFRLTADRVRDAATSALGSNPTTSILKNVGAEVRQEAAELAIEILGLQGLGAGGEGFSAEELEITRAWLSGRAASIYGGTHEVQYNIIAKRILGM